MTGKTKILVTVGGISATVAVGYLIYKIVIAVKELKEEGFFEEQEVVEVDDSEDYGDEERVDSPESHSKASDGVVTYRNEDLDANYVERLKKLREAREKAIASETFNVVDEVDSTYEGEHDEVDSFYAHEQAMNELYPDMGDFAGEPIDGIYEGATVKNLQEWDTPEEPETGGFTDEESEMYRETGYVNEVGNSYSNMSDEELYSYEINTDAVFVPGIKNDVNSPEGWRELKDLLMKNVYDMNNRVVLDNLFEYEWKRPLPMHKQDTGDWLTLKRDLLMIVGCDSKFADKVTVAHLLIWYATKMTQQLDRICDPHDVKDIDEAVRHLLGQIGFEKWPADVFAVELKVAQLTCHTMDELSDTTREYGMFGVDLSGEDLIAGAEYGIEFAEQYRMFIEQFVGNERLY